MADFKQYSKQNGSRRRSESWSDSILQRFEISCGTVSLNIQQLREHMVTRTVFVSYFVPAGLIRH